VKLKGSILHFGLFIYLLSYHISNNVPDFDSHAFLVDYLS